MKDNLEKFKDILYNLSDYLIMASIIIAISLIIGWRLDILFPQTTAMVNTDDLSKIESTTTLNTKKPKPVTDTQKKDESDNSDTQVPETNTEKPVDDLKPVVSEIITIIIPNGTPSSSIGQILLDKGIIESTQAFEEKIFELDLEKSLRSGEYKISKDSTLESIVKTIANKK